MITNTYMKLTESNKEEVIKFINNGIDINKKEDSKTFFDYQSFNCYYGFDSSGYTDCSFRLRNNAALIEQPKNYYLI